MAIVAYKIERRPDFRTYIHPRTVEFLKSLFEHPGVEQVSVEIRKVTVSPSTRATRAARDNALFLHRIEIKRSALGLAYHGLQLGTYRKENGKIHLVI